MSPNPFDRCSDEYGQYRPGYPANLYDHLIDRCDLGSGSSILDIGAGTGKGSEPLRSRGLPIVSMEPSLAMIRQGLRSYPKLDYVAGNAEELPFINGAFRLVTSAQSFHWFQTESAIAEIERVLEHSGYLGVYWNQRDSAAPHVQEFENLVQAFNPRHKPGYRSRDWAAVIEADGQFRLIDHRSFSQTARMTIEDWVGLARSISYIRVIGDEKMMEFEANLRQRLAAYECLDCPYKTEVWLARKCSENAVKVQAPHDR